MKKPINLYSYGTPYNRKADEHYRKNMPPWCSVMATHRVNPDTSLVAINTSEFKANGALEVLKAASALNDEPHVIINSRELEAVRAEQPGNQILIAEFIKTPWFYLATNTTDNYYAFPGIAKDAVETFFRDKVMCGNAIEQSHRFTSAPTIVVATARNITRIESEHMVGFLADITDYKRGTVKSLGDTLMSTLATDMPLEVNRPDTFIRPAEKIYSFAFMSPQKTKEKVHE